MEKQKILAIDDQPAFLDAVGRMLTHLGFEPVLATSARDGLEKLQTSGCAAMLLDLMMPDIPGQAVLRELNRAHCPVPVVAMSGSGTVDDVILAFREHATDFLRKPFALEQLSAALDRALGSAPRQAGERANRDSSGDGHLVIRPPASRSSSSNVAAQLPRSSASTLTSVFGCTSIESLHLPVLDPRIAELHAMLSREDTNMTEVAAAISRDPALCTAVLRRAGAANFGASQSAGLHEACIRLGMREILRVALRMLYENQFAVSTEPYRDMMAASWENAVATSRVAAEIARLLGRRDGDRFLVLGLLHNLGELACLSILAATPDGPSLTREHIGAEVARHHERVGEVLSKGWRLPADVARVVSAHHRAGQDVDGSIILAAWTCACFAGFRPICDQTIGDPYEALRRVGLSELALEPLVELAASTRDSPKSSGVRSRGLPVLDRLRRTTRA
jgi:HD-like signal output (HDOD) protein/DNA-binding response OmpR family regulator